MRSHRFARFLLALPAALLVSCAEQETPTPQDPAALDQSAGAEIAGEFTLVKTAGEDNGGSMATDGTNYLVGFDNGSPNIAKSRLVTAPSTLGPILSTRREAHAPLIGFDGTNYLMVWTDETGGFLMRNVFAQRVNTSGAKVGGLIHITGTDDVLITCGLAYAGGQYVVTYLRFDGRIYRRFVSPAGTVLGAAKAVSSTYGACAGFNNVATDGTDFLAVWLSLDVTSVMARLVRADGTLGRERTLNASPESSEQPVGVAYAGADYLVTWADEITAGTRWDLYGRLVDEAGAPNGGRITIQSSAKVKYPGPVMPSNGNFAVLFADNVGDPPNATMKVRFFSAAGAPLGAAQTVFRTVAGKVAVATAVANGSNFFFAVTRFVPGADPLDYSTYTGRDINGSFKILP